MKPILPSRALSLLLLLTLARGPLAAADATPATPPPDASGALTLADCIHLAAQDHPLLTAASAGVSAASAAVGEARAPFWPQVNLSAGYHRWQQRAFLPSGLTLPGPAVPELIGRLDDWTGGLSSVVTLYDFGERRAVLDAARARLGSAQADAAATRADVRLSVESAFYALAEAEDLRRVAERNLARTESHLALAQARRDAGAVPEADVLRARAEMADARLQVISARSRVRTAAGALNTAMGRPAETPIAIRPPVPSAPPPAADIEADIRRAIADRPELRSDKLRLEAAHANVEAARASRAPKILADGSFGWNDTDFLPQTRVWQVGVSVDLPVFDAGSRTHRIDRNRADVAREQALYDSSVLQVRQQIWAAASELQRAWDSIAANEASVRASAESLRVVRERYQTGAAVITDLLDTETSLARAEASLAEARWTYLADRAAYRRAIGATP